MYFSNNDAQWRSPVAPLPNPGEGGPVDPGFGVDTPVAPLPNPGEGGPIDPDFGVNHPVVPLPNPGEGGPIDPDFGVDHPVFPEPGPIDPDFGVDNTPVIPLPNPGEGGPIDPDFSVNTPIIPLPNPGEGWPIPGPVFPVYPLPNPPCFFCGTGAAGQVRFLNAANSYRPFRVYVNNRFVVSGLGFASLTPYGRVAGGFQTITVTGPDGYIYIQKSMPIRAGSMSTIAIIPTRSGLDLLSIPDEACSRPSGVSCIRMCNLAVNSNPLDLVLYDGRVVYSDVRYKETTSFKRIRPGSYQFYLAETSIAPMPAFVDIDLTGSDLVTNFVLPEVYVSFYVDVRAVATYTIFVLGTGNAPGNIQTLVVEDR